jgi:hypothetical protein
MTRKRVLHREVELIPPLVVFHSTSRREKIERSAEALRARHRPFSFPPNKKPCHNTAQATAQAKRQGMAKPGLRFQTLPKRAA